MVCEDETTPSANTVEAQSTGVVAAVAVATVAAADVAGGAGQQVGPGDHGTHRWKQALGPRAG